MKTRRQLCFLLQTMPSTRSFKSWWIPITSCSTGTSLTPWPCAWNQFPVRKKCTSSMTLNTVWRLLIGQLVGVLSPLALTYYVQPIPIILWRHFADLARFVFIFLTVGLFNFFSHWYLKEALRYPPDIFECQRYRFLSDRHFGVSFRYTHFHFFSWIDIIDEKYMRLLRIIMRLAWMMYSPDFRQEDIPAFQKLVRIFVCIYHWLLMDFVIINRALDI